MTVVIFVFVIFAVVVAISDMITTSDRVGRAFDLVWAAAVVGTGLWLLLAEPRRVEVQSEGLRFVAPGRAVFIGWADLRSVSSPWFDINRESLHWRFGRLGREDTTAHQHGWSTRSWRSLAPLALSFAFSLQTMGEPSLAGR